MINPANIFVCFIFFVLQDRLHGFPISRLSSNWDALSWSTAQRSASSWTFPATRLYFSYKRNQISSTSLPFLPAAVTCKHKRILSSNDRSLILTPKIRSYSSSDKMGTRRAVTRPLQPSPPSPTDIDDIINLMPPFDEKGPRRDVSSSYSSLQRPLPTDSDAAVSVYPPSAVTYLRVSSPSYEKKLQKTFSMTTSYAMRLQSNFRLSKQQQESPVIVFDQNGKMHTNVYPPIGYHSNDNKRKSGDGDWSRRYLPKWLVIGGKKT